MKRKIHIRNKINKLFLLIMKIQSLMRSLHRNFLVKTIHSFENNGSFYFFVLN